jgi:glucose/arabinose dehydrogenase
MRPGHLYRLLLVPLLACGRDDTSQTTSPAADSSYLPQLAVTVPPAASVIVTVTVPSTMRTSPFNVTRQLTVPPNWSAAVYARIPGARFMAMAPNGHLLVSQPSQGKISIIRPSGTSVLISTFASGLAKPHDMVFHKIGSTTYLYVSEKNKVIRYRYTNGDLTGKNRQVIVSNLPDASLPELGGSYGHELKNIALDRNNRLYVSIASTCNVCLNDTQSNPVRAAIYRYNADGTGGSLFARGLRNAEGLAHIPGTSTLWVVVNNRDNLPYPFNDGTGQYGKVIQSWVDDHPPEEFTRVRSGGNYGWPFCNPNPDQATGMVNMPFDLDYNMNQSGSVNCSTMDRINRGIQAHSAPLGLLFLQNTTAPTAYRSGAAVALHGSWNRAQKTGYKVIYFPWDNTAQLPAAPIDLVRGWLIGNASWGRPVDIAVGPGGAVYVSDDQSGTVYKFTSSVP